MNTSPTSEPSRWREPLARARLMLLFSPGLCSPRDPREILDAVFGLVDIVQIRAKTPGSHVLGSARETYDASLLALDLASVHGRDSALVIVNDRVDVAAALLDRGCAGVHVGQDDCPVELARQTLGPSALVGLSTHSMQQVGDAWDRPVDYLGFGPVYPSSTKGYASGLGPESAWIASQGSPIPLFPIGGIDPTNLGELARVGRAAVSSAILRAEDPAAAARELRSLLSS